MVFCMHWLSIWRRPGVISVTRLLCRQIGPQSHRRYRWRSRTAAASRWLSYRRSENRDGRRLACDGWPCALVHPSTGFSRSCCDMKTLFS